MQGGVQAADVDSALPRLGTAGCCSPGGAAGRRLFAFLRGFMLVEHPLPILPGH